MIKWWVYRLRADLATLRAEKETATAGLRRYADALLLAWGGVCPSNWATTGDPMEMAETIRARGDELQAAEASRDALTAQVAALTEERDEFMSALTALRLEVYERAALPADAPQEGKS